ncbi:MAG: hypothetical protein NT029_12325 [Armatimonadetes bacterium]|nr:hypothetical protein [Armatimonadota bacterium]
MTDTPAETADFRACPICGSSCRAAAIRCGKCWSELRPMKPGDVGVETRVINDGSSRWDSAEMQHYRNAPRRACPRCQRQVMAAATTCGFCWVKLTPVKACP